MKGPRGYLPLGVCHLFLTFPRQRWLIASNQHVSEIAPNPKIPNRDSVIFQQRSRYIGFYTFFLKNISTMSVTGRLPDN